MDKNNMAELFRQELIESERANQPAMDTIDRRVDDLSEYLGELESFIERQKQKELSDLERAAANLSDERRAQFWMWHYPTYWDDVFRMTLRSSFILMSVSFLEHELRQVCRDVEVITQTQISVTDLRGSIVDRSKTFLHVFGKFKTLDDERWTYLSRLYDLRNLIVHRNGWFAGFQNENSLKQFIERHEGISIENGSVHIEKRFCEQCLGQILIVLKTLRGEVAELCRRQG